jgi:hypothetical protein
MTNKQLEKLCRTWQKRLRLQDWDISIKFSRRADMGDYNWGHTESQRTSKSAHIFVCHPWDAHPQWMGGYGTEHTVVHELIHLHFPVEPADKTEAYLLEQGIDLLAHALVEAYRCADSQRKSKSGRTRSR